MEENEIVYKVILHPSVTYKIASHCEFLAEVSEAAARNLWSNLYDDIASLSFMPRRFPVLNSPNIESEQHRWRLSCKRYRIIFTIVGETVYVDDIHDCRQALLT
ncbi:MAG: type II toxin-antitoxin system RelE/ParE family toxin [Oscillospiraceae bacterium]|jgi:hypothetical protein|nr:type II toxin-antitoxin system RelE/ParE family toxin [Oscillospiraceae bacterium]